MLPFASLINSIKQQATDSFHRQLIILQGDKDWSEQQALTLIEQHNQAYLYCGPEITGIKSSLASQCLGQDSSLLIINAHSGFDSNTFCAAEGTLIGGGLLILMLPAGNYSDLFHGYLYQQLDDNQFITIRQDQDLPKLPSSNSVNQSQTLNLDEQKQAVQAVMKTVTGHRRRPLVLTANRGRGKSAALGIAAATLLNENRINNILVCAANKQATFTLFKHAKSELNDTSEHPFHLQTDQGHITFIAPDQLLQALPVCDLLLVDEAAALPVSTLESLVVHYSRLVFATTMHGYEGSGRGFALRFQKQLKQLAPQYRQLHLQQPIRWADNDPVENFTLNTLCLTDNPIVDSLYNKHQPVKFCLVSADQLAADINLLKQVFSLLVTAHYQTKPSDLHSLLSDRTLSVFVLKQQQQIFAVALVNKEGQLEDSLAKQVWLGERRVQGHLVAQSLTFHSGFKQAALHQYARVQRIAVQPQLQQQGLGKKLIEHIEEYCRDNQVDHLCSSFGATPELINFWQQLGFSSLRLGVSRDKSSGTYSVIVNKALSTQAQNLHQQIQQDFHHQLNTQLSRHLQQIDSEVVLGIISETEKSLANPDTFVTYTQGHRGYEYIEEQLIQLIRSYDLSTLAKQQQLILVDKVLLNYSWPELAKKHQYTGKKQAQLAIKEAVTQLLNTEE